LKTLQIIDNLIPDSSEGRRVVTIANELYRNGYGVTVASAFKDEGHAETVKRLLEPGVEVLWHHPVFRFSKFCYSPDLYGLLSGSDYDVVHAHSYRHYGTYVGALLRKNRNIPFVLSPYGSSGYGSSRKFMSLYLIQDLITRKYPLKYSDRILAETEFEKKRLIAFGSDASKIDVVYREVDTKAFRKLDKNVFENSSTLIFIGRITPIKGIELIINVLSHLDENIHLSIIGPIENSSYFNKLQELISEKRLRNRVRFHGEISHDDIPKYCSSALALILPSLYENLGGVILEAQACECPVIAIKVGGIPEIIKDGETGYILKERSPKKMAEKIKLLSGDFPLRNRMGSKGREFMRSHFSVDDFINKLQHAYEKAMNVKNL